jgi:hypothetical protein
MLCGGFEVKGFKEFFVEDAVPANAAGTGQVAGIGVGSNGEPGVNKKKKKTPILATLIRRKPNGTQK